MDHLVKVVVNTAASFTKVCINAIVSLVATRIALRVLGASDYGLFNLIAGTITLLSFVNGALMISAQRYFSIALGERDDNKLNEFYNTSLSIHIIIGLLIVVVLFVLRWPLFNGFLNIEAGSLDVAKRIYDIMTLSAGITIITIPFSAIMNSHEDMVMMAVAEIISCLVKLLAAIVILYVSHDQLLIYTLVTLGAVFVKAIIEYVWSKLRYPEVKCIIKRMTNLASAKDMFSFVGWNTLGSSAVVVRNQGVAIILNLFFGTVINSAYGIANQVNSLVLAFSSTLTTVFSPIIIKAKGEGDEEKMRKMAIFSSKMSFLLSGSMALPILLFLTPILRIWLGDYPEFTESFCVVVVLSFLVLQLYPGINRAIYATGKIKGYQIAISIILISILPIGYYLFKIGMKPYAIMIAMFVAQVFTLVATVFFAKKHCGFSVSKLYKEIVFLPLAAFVVILIVSYTILPLLLDMNLTGYSLGTKLLCIIGVGGLVDILFCLFYYLAVINREEKQYFKGLVNRIKR